MATSLTISFRCQNKNLASIPATGEAPATDAVSINLQEVSAAPGFSPRASFSVTLPIASDTFVMGGYYTATVVDGAAPSGAAAMSAEPAPAAAATVQTKIPAK